PDEMLPLAGALELIHTYSLIHDDLPAMDNDDYRRGKLTNHKVYGEAMAILAGDALLTLAFELCSRADLMDDLDAGRQIRIVQELAIGSGNRGMVGGQVLDIEAERQDIDLATLQTIHTHKTGMLIRAAVRMGALVARATPAQLEQLTGYAEDIGLAFQIADDVLNVTGTREELGKNANTDAERGKKTYPTFYGVDGAQQLATECTERAIGRLGSFDAKADPLRALARYITSRKS
ncbi:MAG TPA: farnesyl diphosphate synthase, partial [Nitrospirales bacterium]|nr:farnesyl diphosphate synthase [Nitrospirales bacterium]